MSLELINTLGTVITVLIVAAAAVAALVQLRHLRAGNQINAMLSIGEEFSAKRFSDAQTLVREQLEAALNDPLFREYNVALDRRHATPDVKPEYEELHKAVNLVGNSYEELGILVKNGVVDQSIFLDRYSWVIAGNWTRLEKLLGLAREATGNVALWENFEYLAVLSEDWMRARPNGTYPARMRRMAVRNPWPIAPEPAIL